MKLYEKEKIYLYSLYKYTLNHIDTPRRKESMFE